MLYFLPENEGTYVHCFVQVAIASQCFSIDTNDYICMVDVENLMAAEEYSYLSLNL